MVEFCLFRADKNRNKPAELEKYVTVLKEVVMHHVKEEEDELLPKAKKAMEDEKLEELGAEMESRFEKAMKSDFRRPLRENLQQVLAAHPTAEFDARFARPDAPASAEDFVRAVYTDLTRRK